MKRPKYHPETSAVRGAADLGKKNGPLATPIYQTATFEVTDNHQQLRATSTDMFYTRYGNPTHTVAERAIAELGCAERSFAVCFRDGWITAIILALVKAGDHIVAQEDIYGGVTKFLTSWLPKFGVETTFVSTTNFDAGRARAIRPNTKLLYVESPTNPMLKVVDIRRVATLAKQHGLITMIDGTFATPINQRPVGFGIDLVLHSGTKYFAGHADLICGVAAGRKDLY